MSTGTNGMTFTLAQVEQMFGSPSPSSEAAQKREQEFAEALERWSALIDPPDVKVGVGTIYRYLRGFSAELLDDPVPCPRVLRLVLAIYAASLAEAQRDWRFGDYGKYDFYTLQVVHRMLDGMTDVDLKPLVDALVAEIRTDVALAVANSTADTMREQAREAAAAAEAEWHREHGKEGEQ